MKDVADAANSLKNMLSQLEKENKKLTGDLEVKRKERATRIKEAKAAQKKMHGHLEKIDGHLAKGRAALDKQTGALAGIKKIVKQQEQTLKDLHLRLERLEHGLRGGKMSIPDARRELMKMLEDLQGMKKQREKIMSSEGKVNATNFPSFRLDP